MTQLNDTTLTGCGTALATPFTRSGDLDERALRGFVDWQIDEGIDFVVPCGSTGEAATMSLAEHRRVVEITVEQARGRVPVVAGAGSNDTRKAIELSRMMKEAGATHLLHVSPMYNKPPQRGIVAHFQAIADSTSLPIVVYNVPGRTGSNIEAATTLELARHKRIVATKEASANLAQISDCIAGQDDGFSVLSGDDELTLPILALGGRGLISVVSNVVPKLMTELVRAGRAGKLDHARQLHMRLLPWMRAAFTESNPLPVKAALAMMGKMENVLRSPLVPMDEKKNDAVKAALKAAGAVTAIDQLFAGRILTYSAVPAGMALPPQAEEDVTALLDALEAGTVRAAERDADGQWNAVEWVKRGILVGFRVGKMVDMSIGGHHGEPRFGFFDKHVYPPQQFSVEDGVRIVPGGSSIRRGAYLAPGVVCMPPAYVNVGAHVGTGTMIDSHALVGSCAQVGERVHLSAAAQVGGVLEPVNASPVVIEDDVLVGGNCGVYEGTVVRAKAVLAAGVVLTRGTPVYDLVHERVYRAEGDRPLEIPAGAVVVPGARRVAKGWGAEQGLSLQTPVIVKYRDEKTDLATALEGWLR